MPASLHSSTAALHEKGEGVTSADAQRVWRRGWLLFVLSASASVRGGWARLPRHSKRLFFCSTSVARVSVDSKEVKDMREWVEKEEEEGWEWTATLFTGRGVRKASLVEQALPGTEQGSLTQPCRGSC